MTHGSERKSLVNELIKTEAALYAVQDVSSTG